MGTSNPPSNSRCNPAVYQPLCHKYGAAAIRAGAAVYNKCLWYRRFCRHKTYYTEIGFRCKKKDCEAGKSEVKDKNEIPDGRKQSMRVKMFKKTVFSDN